MQAMTPALKALDAIDLIKKEGEKQGGGGWGVTGDSLVLWGEQEDRPVLSSLTPVWSVRL